MQVRKEAVVALFHDIPHATYSGIRPQPGVDIEFRLDRFRGTARIIRARLVRVGTDPVESFGFVSGGSFEMSTLGRDYVHLETIGAELTSIAGFVEHISITIESDGSALMRMLINGDEQFFKIYTRELDRGLFSCWDWFAHPSSSRGIYTDPLHVARPIGEVAKVLAAA